MREPIEKDEKWFREHVRRCSCGGRRSWTALIRHLMLEGGVPGPRGPQGISLLVAPVAQPPRRLYVRLSLSCHRPRPDASATTDRRIVIVSEIGDPADSDRHRRPPFPFFFFITLPRAFSLSRKPPLSVGLADTSLFLLLNLRLRQKAVLSPWLAG